MKVTLIAPTKSLENREAIMLNTSKVIEHELIIVEGQNPSYQRNEAVKKATGEILYFIDNDSVVDKGNVEKALALFEADGKLAIVGGPSLTPDTDTVLQKSFGAALASPFSTGKSSARYKSTGVRRETDEKEVILCNCFVRKNVFDELTGFNENLYPNEENEFMNRVKALGYKIIYDPEIRVKRSNRATFGLFLKQCFTYGRGRAEQIRVKFEKNDLINMVPALFVCYLLMLAGFTAADASIDLVFGAPLLAYLLGALFFSFKALAEIKNEKVFMLLLFMLPSVHLCYGTGMIYGFMFFGKKSFDKNIQILAIPPGRKL